MILTQEWKNERNERNETFFNCLPVCNAGYNADDTGNCFCSTNRCIVIAKKCRISWQSRMV